ncbi:MAG: flavodoxin [Candidatus Hadarchaeota archaeon]
MNREKHSPTLVGTTKHLVVYYSRSGTTKKVGEAIARELKADSEEIIDLKKRTGLRPIRWLIAGRDARKRKLTEIKVKKNPGKYDIVVIGTPNWASNIAPAVRTYLTSHYLAGKKVGIFCTAGGDGFEKPLAEMEGLMKKSIIAGRVGVSSKEMNSGDYKDKVTSFTKILKSGKK